MRTVNAVLCPVCVQWLTEGVNTWRCKQFSSPRFWLVTHIFWAHSGPYFVASKIPSHFIAIVGACKLWRQENHLKNRDNFTSYVTATLHCTQTTDMQQLCYRKNIWIPEIFQLVHMVYLRNYRSLFHFWTSEFYPKSFLVPLLLSTNANHCYQNLRCNISIQSAEELFYGPFFWTVC